MRRRFTVGSLDPKSISFRLLKRRLGVMKNGVKDLGRQGRRRAKLRRLTTFFMTQVVTRHSAQFPASSSLLADLPTCRLHHTGRATITRAQSPRR